MKTQQLCFGYSRYSMWPTHAKKKKLCLPEANHVHPLRHNLDDDDKQNLFHRIAGRIVWNLICTVHAKFPAILSTWMVADEGAGHCFGYQFGYSRKTGQATMFMSCNWTPASPPPLHIQAHAKILLRPTPLLSYFAFKVCLRVFEELSCIPWKKRSEVISKTTRCKQKLSAGSNGLKTLRGEVCCFCCVKHVAMWIKLRGTPSDSTCREWHQRKTHASTPTLHQVSFYKETPESL